MITTQNERHQRRFTELAKGLPLACLYWALLSTAGAVQAGTDHAANPGVVPPNSKPLGKSYSEWGALWWQWALSFAPGESPLGDPDGALAGQRQLGSVWFLGGTFSALPEPLSGDVTRTVTVPPGTFLFFPIVNSIWVSAYTSDPTGIDDIRARVEQGLDPVTTFGASIDLKPIENVNQYRAESPLFCTPVKLFGVNSPGDLGCEPTSECTTANKCTNLPYPEELSALFGPLDVYGPALTDGYWLMLSPLSVGQHSIVFYAGTGDSVQHFTYTITVAR